METIRKNGKQKIIETIEYNGRYTDVSTIRDRIISAGATVVIITCALIISYFIF